MSTPRFRTLRHVSRQRGRSHARTRKIAAFAAFRDEPRKPAHAPAVLHTRAALFAVPPLRLAAKDLWAPVDGRTERNHIAAVAGTLITGVPTRKFNL